MAGMKPTMHTTSGMMAMGKGDSGGVEQVHRPDTSKVSTTTTGKAQAQIQKHIAEYLRSERR